MINVNLLPPELKEEIAQAKKNAKSLSFLKKLFLVLVVIGFLIGLTFAFLNFQTKSVITQLTKEEKEIDKFGSLADNAKKISERLSTIKSIDQNTNKWSSVVEEIQKTVPEGVYLTQIKMDAAPKSRNQLAGSASSKKEVASFREAMEKSNKFEFVDIESSTTTLNQVTKKEAENFTITFSLSKEALK